MPISHTFHLVDELPHRTSIFTRVEDDGDIQTYVSLAYDRETNAADLGWVFTYLSAVWELDASLTG